MRKERHHNYHSSKNHNEKKKRKQTITEKKLKQQKFRVKAHLEKKESLKFKEKPYLSFCVFYLMLNLGNEASYFKRLTDTLLLKVLLCCGEILLVYFLFLSVYLFFVSRTDLSTGLENHLILSPIPRTPVAPISLYSLYSLDAPILIENNPRKNHIFSRTNAKGMQLASSKRGVTMIECD